MKKTTKVDPKITELKSDVLRLDSALKRALADYANLERRFGEQSSAVIKFAKSDLLVKLLDIRDHLAMACTQIQDQSLTMILGSLDKLLTEEGVTQVKTDGLYDPTSMECQEMGVGEKDTVVKVIRSGYLLHDRVLRTARVVVGSGTPAAKGHSLFPKGLTLKEVPNPNAAKGHSLTGDVAKGQDGTPKAEGVSL